MGDGLAGLPASSLAVTSAALLGVAAGALAVLLMRRIRAGGAGVGIHLTRLDQVTARLTAFESTLTVPQERGRLGELLLEQLLATWLPR